MPQGLMREVMETYKPHILSRRRRLIEDCVRDLRLNNDHIHIIEQEMRLSLQVKIGHFQTLCKFASGHFTSFLSLEKLPHSQDFIRIFSARTK